MKSSQETQTFSIDSLRKSLAKETASQNIFKIDEKADATEALTYILKMLHDTFN